MRRAKAYIEAADDHNDHRLFLFHVACRARLAYFLPARLFFVAPLPLIALFLKLAHTLLDQSLRPLRPMPAERFEDFLFHLVIRDKEVLDLCDQMLVQLAEPAYSL